MNTLRLFMFLAFFLSGIDALAQSPFAPSFTSFEENELELDGTAGVDCCDYYAVRRCELNVMATEPQCVSATERLRPPGSSTIPGNDVCESISKKIETTKSTDGTTDPWIIIQNRFRDYFRKRGISSPIILRTDVELSPATDSRGILDLVIRDQQRCRLNVKLRGIRAPNTPEDATSSLCSTLIDSAGIVHTRLDPEKVGQGPFQFLFEIEVDNPFLPPEKSKEFVLTAWRPNKDSATPKIKQLKDSIAAVRETHIIDCRPEEPSQDE